MFEKVRKAIDAFSFSLGGMRMASSFVITPAIASDRINQVRDERVRRALEARNDDARGWPEGHRQAAQNCAQQGRGVQAASRIYRPGQSDRNLSRHRFQQKIRCWFHLRQICSMFLR